MASSSLQWSHTLTRLFAAMWPLAATAGTPMPGNVESPQHSRPAQPQTVKAIIYADAVEASGDYAEGHTVASNLFPYKDMFSREAHQG